MSNNPSTLDRIKRFLGVTPVLGGGIAVGLSALEHLVAPDEQLIGIAFSGFVLLVLSVPLIAGSYWLATNGFDQSQIWRVTAWCLAGSVPLVILANFTVVYERSHGVILADSGFVIAAVAGVGLLGGFFTGVYNVRRNIERTAHREVANWLDTIIDESPVAIVTVDEDCVVEMWNNAAEQLFGWQKNEVIGERCPIVPADHQQVQQTCACVFDGTATGDVVCRRSDGSRVTVERWSATLTEEDSDSVKTVGIMADINDRKRKQQQLAVLYRILRHNLRNSVNIIYGHTEILRGEITDDGLKQNANTIASAAKDIISISEKASEIETALKQNNTRNYGIDVMEIIADVTSDIEQEYPHATITVDAPESAWIQADSTIKGAIHEVITNAVKHNDQPVPEVQIAVDKTGDSSRTVTMSIADTGPGIPETERIALRAEEETPLEHASGLGLWLIKWVVTAAGGKMSITDNEPRGSVVTLTLPSQPTKSGQQELRENPTIAHAATFE